MNARQPIQISNPQSRITSDRIGWISDLVGGKSYLEIGVFDGETFTNVKMDRKVAVDPRFKFDWQSFQSDKVSLHQMFSDDFFKSQPRELFDIIFIDGLHTFSQSFRDFCATLALSHDKTVWLIDDTLPNDAFSMDPSSGRTMKLREMHGLNSQTWHGDVFRTAFAIHDFFPTMDLRTINSYGNPQTLLVKSQRPNFAPRWNDLEKIGRLSYGDFVENLDCLQCCSEADAKTWMKSVFDNR